MDRRLLAKGGLTEDSDRSERASVASVSRVARNLVSSPRPVSGVARLMGLFPALLGPLTL